MIPGPALARWLADREAQARSFGRVDAFADKWGTQPLMTQLEREVAELGERTDSALIDAARHFMDKTGEIDAMMRELIAASRGDPFFRPPFHPVTSEIHNSLLLYHHPDLSITLGVTGVDMLAAKKIARKGPASINFTGTVTLLRFLEAGEAVLSFWEAPEIRDDFVLAEAGPCRLTGRRRIADGEEIVIDGRARASSSSMRPADISFFQAVARANSAPVGVEYDSDTRAASARAAPTRRPRGCR